LKTLKEKSSEPSSSGAESDIEIPGRLQRKNLDLPKLSEIESARHFHKLAEKNYGVLDGIYPLGSCTMKYNPPVIEEAARGVYKDIHPYTPESQVQGVLSIYYNLQEWLSEITGMDAFTMQPLAGAHGELTGLMLIKAYQSMERDEIIIPDSSHGTNPASASMAGFRLRQIDSSQEGLIDLDKLREAVSEKTAGLMLTNPNTLGLFEEDILEIADIVHEAGGLLYYDGANLNAIMGKTRPGDMDFDIVHVNLHKTFGTPHGGGGPGSGPVGVKKKLESYLPTPVVDKDRDGFYWRNDLKDSIGRVSMFHGNFKVLLKAYLYIKLLGGEGLEGVSEYAVLNARYLQEKLKETFDLPFDKPCMHEFVLSARRQKHEYDVKALQIAKRLLDYGVHAPTIYFPLIVEEALMIEPTETEPKESLDRFIGILEEIAGECRENPEKVNNAPHDTPVGRLDEVKAVKDPKLTWRMSDEG